MTVLNDDTSTSGANVESTGESVIGELFPEDPDGVFISLGWAGRQESPADLAARFEAMFALVRNLVPVEMLRWYHSTSRPQPVLDEVPPAGPALARWIVDATEELGEGRPTWSSVRASLRTDPSQTSRELARVRANAGAPIKSANTVVLSLGSEFPVGTPTEMVRFLLDLVRIWEPDAARVLTDRAIALMSPSTHAAYASWTSALARGDDPVGKGETAVPFGDGTVWVADEWSVEALVALNGELVEAGAPRLSRRQPVQVLPHVPDGVPEGLVEVCSKIRFPGARGGVSDAC